MLWICISIGNNILLNLRGTPLTGNDFRLINSALQIIDTYLTKKNIIMLFAFLIIIISSLICLFVFAPKHKHKINYALSIGIWVSIIFICKYSTNLAMKNSIISTNFWDLVASYESYGFPYCFSTTLINNGIDRPSNYSKDTIDNISYSLKYETEFDSLSTLSTKLNNTGTNPNIIMIQLESFFDPTFINGVEFNIDPIPNFRYLKDMGYSTHAIHNHEGNFYGRNIVFSNLGFDTFTPVEYMNVTERTPVGWAKDSSLIQPIMDALNSTDSEDFIYTISVQGHGNYPTEDILENKPVTITNIENESIKTSLEYYVNQLYEMDKFISDIINAVSNIDEESVIVFFGDHLPSFGFTNSSLSTGNVHLTEYVVWDNIGLAKNDIDLEAYQLTSRVLYDLDINDGLFTKLHQNYLFGANDSSEYTQMYLSELKLLQYDALYGQNYMYSESSIPKATNLHLGTKEIVLQDIYIENGQLVAKGENFNQNTIFLVDGNFITTTLVDNNTVTCSAPSLNKDGSTVYLGQISGGAKLLSTTNVITLTP